MQIINFDQVRQVCVWSNTKYSDYCDTHECKSCQYYKNETEYCLPYCEVIELEDRERMETETELLHWLHLI